MHETPATSRAIESRLSDVLDELIEQHDRLIETIASKRDAIRRADSEALAEAMRSEAAIATEIERLETDRRSIVAQVARRLGLTAADGVNISMIAERLPEAAREALLDRRARLRRRIVEAREQGAIVRVAADSLRAHVAGLLQRIQMSVNRSTTYGRDGRIGGVAMAGNSCIDLRQ